MNKRAEIIGIAIPVFLAAAWAQPLFAQATYQRIEWPGSYHVTPAWSPDDAFVAVNPDGGNRIVLADREKNVLTAIEVEDVRFIGEIGWINPRLLYSESSAGRFAVYFDLWDVSTDHKSIHLGKRVLVIGGDDCRISPDLHYLACHFSYDDSVNDFVVIADTTIRKDPDEEVYEDPEPFEYPDRNSLLEGGELLDGIRLGLNEWVEIPTGPPFSLRIVDVTIGYRGSSRYLILEAARLGKFTMVGSTTYWGECFMAQCDIQDGMAMRFENYKTGQSYGIRFFITDFNNRRFCIDTVRMLHQEFDLPFLWDPASTRMTAFEKVGGRRYRVDFSLDQNGRWRAAKNPL